MSSKRKTVPKKASTSNAEYQRGSTTDPFLTWDFHITQSRVAIFKRIWKLYTALYDGDAQYAIVDRGWITTKRKAKPWAYASAKHKFYIKATTKGLKAQPWYPNYKKAVEFTSSYESLRSCLEEARVNYTIYAIFRVEHSKIKFVLHRRTEDIRIFQHKTHRWRLIGGSSEDIPFDQIPIDPDRICKYFQMRMYTSPGYL